MNKIYEQFMYKHIVCTTIKTMILTNKIHFSFTSQTNSIIKYSMRKITATFRKL